MHVRRFIRIKLHKPSMSNATMIIRYVVLSPNYSLIHFYDRFLPDGLAHNDR